MQQPIKPTVVFHKKFREQSRPLFFWLSHQPTPTMDSAPHNIDLVPKPPAVSLEDALSGLFSYFGLSDFPNTIRISSISRRAASS
jgi:hypothetical protein